MGDRKLAGLAHEPRLRHMSDIPPGEEIREVYAHFGLAYYESEVLHRGLCNYYALAPFESRESVSRIRIEERLDLAWSTTLGQMVGRLRKEVDLNSDLVDRLQKAVEKRNSLAHDFWFENAHKLSSQAGVQELVDELTELVDLFESLDQEISEHTRSVAENLGVTEEALDGALEDVLAGRDQEPLHDQRRPNKQERVVSAYAVPHPEGHQLIFETRDGELWQLSDVGLAWTTYEEVSDEWEGIDQINAYLPATIDPRPTTDGPYNFCFELANDAVCRVEKRGKEKVWRVDEG